MCVYSCKRSSATQDQHILLGRCVQGLVCVRVPAGERSRREQRELSVHYCHFPKAIFMGCAYRARLACALIALPPCAMRSQRRLLYHVYTLYAIILCSCVSMPMYHMLRCKQKCIELAAAIHKCWHATHMVDAHMRRAFATIVFVMQTRSHNKENHCAPRTIF